MAKIGSGIGEAAYRFLIIGVLFPFALDFFQPEITKYVSLPPSQERWIALGLFGAIFAITGFLQKAYSKGDYPWLFGRLGGGVATFVFYSYLFLYLPTSSLTEAQGLQARGLLMLIYASIGLSYLYLILDFADARRSKTSAKVAQQ